MNQDRAIREEIVAFLLGRVSLAVLERSLGSKSWSMFKDGSPNEVINLIAAFNLVVSEFYDSIVEEDVFRRELFSLVNNINGSVDQTAPFVVPPREIAYEVTGKSSWLKPQRLPVLPVGFLAG